MNLLLAPGIRLMNRLRYPWKFGLMGLISLGVLGYLSVSLLSALYADIRFSQRELAGLPPVESLLRVVQLTQQHRGLSSGVLSGGANLRPKLDAKTAELAEALQKADQALTQASLGQPIEARWKQILADWEGLRSQGLSMAAKDNAAAHTRLIAQQLLTLHDVGDSSGLVLDPDAESYYVIDNVVRRIPDLAERLGRLRAMGTAALAAQQMDDQRRLDISVQLGALSMVLDDFYENVDRAGGHNPKLQSRLAALKLGVQEGTGKVQDELRNRILKGVLDTPPANYFELVTRAIDGAYNEVFGTALPELRAALESQLAAKERTAWMTLTICGLMLVLLAYLSLSAYLVVVGSVRELSRAAAEMAQGNLRPEIKFSSEDELRDVAEQFQRMASAFQAVIREVQHGAEQVTACASSLAANAERVSQGSEQQSEAASGMAAAVEEMTVGVDEIARNAGTAEDISGRSGSLSKEGGAVVSRAMAEMQGIADVVRESAQVIHDLGVQSEKISAMVNSIQEIADQTNLLALNAAIEAARAGESGRGFAVVADEVRKLAERTGQATREITNLVSTIQGGTHKAVATMHDGVLRVEQGVALTVEAGQSMEQIRAGADQVVQAVADISLALREQSAASTEIARNVERIASRAEENSLEVRETAATAGRLEGLARGLQEQVGRFRV